MAAYQSKIDKKANAQMKNNAYFSFQRPKDFLTVFGPHVIQEFPYIKSKIAPCVNAKPTNIVLQRVDAARRATGADQSPGKVSKKSMRDIFYRGDRDSEEHEQLRVRK